MISGPKYKICRRLGSGVYDKCQTQQYTLSEARHTRTRGPRGKQLSDYGKQLLEKQKVRFSYGITEHQLRRYVELSTKKELVGDPTSRLLTALELRLDNVVYRSGLANSRRAARQMVSHGHITVNGKKMNIPSYIMKSTDTFSVRGGSQQKPLFEKQKERLADTHAASWLVFNPLTLEGTLRGMPTIENTEIAGNLSSVLEFYSR